MTNSRKKVVVAGHICLDITPVFPPQSAHQPLGELLSPGRLVQMEGVDVHTGGAVANTGLAMLKLGADVTLMGKVGEDAFGTLVGEILQQEGYHGSLLRSPDSTTSYSVVVAVPGVDRIFLHSPGANNTFCCDDLDYEAIAQSSLFHFGYPPIMERMYQNGGEELAEMLRRVKSLGVATSLDLAAVDPASPAGQADWAAILRRALPYVDFFVPSVEELCFMLDRPRYQRWLERAKGQDVTLTLNPDEDIAPLAEQCLNMGAKVVLIKSGAPGLYCRTAGAEALSPLGLNPAEWADFRGFEASYCPEVVRSGTGAGDTSIAAFLIAMLEGRPLSQCLNLAAATGASCVEQYDALSGLRSFPELEEKIAAGWQKQRFS